MTLLGAAEIRALAEKLDLKPAKSLGQNFVIDANAVSYTHLTLPTILRV